MSISVLGSGAFGTSLAIALANGGHAVTLWSRNANIANSMQTTRGSGPRLPGHDLPDSLTVTADIGAFEAPICLIAVPMQSLSEFLADLPPGRRALIACCKGVDRATGLGPVETIATARPDADAAILTGPSFAADIARGLPTALVLAASDPDVALRLQQVLTRPALRLYRSTDVIGAELGGALKNVIAIAAGIAIGARQGDSARASVIARGFSEMRRFAAAKGAETETIHGLSGLGDLVLTCTSDKSRNFAAGIALGSGEPPAQSVTVEGLATAPAVAREAEVLGLDLPLIRTVTAVVEGKLDIAAAIETLLSRPVGEE